MRTYTSNLKYLHLTLINQLKSQPMKKLLLFITVTFLSFNSFASHMMGGQITSKNLGGLTYEVTLTAYRDMTGIPISTIDAFNYSNAAGTWSITNYVNLTSWSVFGNGVEEYIYIDTITFPVPGDFKVNFEECCRNGAIQNIVGGSSLYLNNTIFVDPTNSSPVFSNPPITLAQFQVPFFYNPLPFDADGDSISWDLDIPLNSGGVPVGGYTLPAADPLGPFALNQTTGEITFLPNMLGNFEVSFRVSEFRNGVKIGEIRRDMQIIVVTSNNAPPIIGSTSNTYPFSGKTFSISPGNSFTMSVAATDPDGQSVSISATGEPLNLATNPAIFTFNNTMGSASGLLTWSPSSSQARTAPYIACMRVSENFGTNTFQQDITYVLHVNTITSINDILSNSSVNVYPNPSNGNFTLAIQSEKASEATVLISNLIGQQMKEFNQHLNAGLNAISVQNLQLPDGKYLVNIISNDGRLNNPVTFNIKN